MKLKMHISKSEVMKLAWQFVRANALSMSEALHKAWENLKLKFRMGRQICAFAYIKRDGSLRFAAGTLMNCKPEDVERHNMGAHLQTYYDTDKREFRSFVMANLCC